MTETSSDLMNLDILDREFVMLLEQYQQVSNTYFSLNETESSQLISLQGSAVNAGTLLSYDSLPSVNCCQSLCSSISNCTAANYDAQSQLCAIGSGNVELYNINNNSFYAIVSTKMGLLIQLQNINQQLYNILNSSAILVKQVNPDSEAKKQQLRIETDKLRFKYDLFQRNKLELDNMIKESNELDNEYNVSSIMVKQSNLSYFFWSVGAIIIIIIAIRLFYKDN
jgi:hypothetical protein